MDKLREELAKLTLRSSNVLKQREQATEQDPNRWALLRHDTFTDYVYARGFHAALIQVAELFEQIMNAENLIWWDDNEVN